MNGQVDLPGRALLAQRILSDCLDFLTLPQTEDDNAWSDASVRMADAAFESDDWDIEAKQP